MANLRVHVAKKLGLIPEYGTAASGSFLWVVNPPLFEYDEDTKTLGGGAPRLHPAARRATSSTSTTDPGKVKCYRYDVVLNGFEIGGGSIRLHDPEVQAEVFKALGIGDEEAREQVRLPARRAQVRRAAARRHRARAWTGWRCCSPARESLRDVIPFPKTQKGTDLMTGAPGDVDERQLRDLHVRPAPPPQK